MISFLCAVWLLYHIISEQCCMWRAQYQGYKKKKKNKKNTTDFNGKETSKKYCQTN